MAIGLRVKFECNECVNFKKDENWCKLKEIKIVEGKCENRKIKEE